MKIRSKIPLGEPNKAYCFVSLICAGKRTRLKRKPNFPGSGAYHATVKVHSLAFGSPFKAHNSIMKLNKQTNRQTTIIKRYRVN